MIVLYLLKNAEVDNYYARSIDLCNHILLCIMASSID